MSRLVALSTGHSKKDSGAISRIDGTKEYDVNCAIVDLMERWGLHNAEFEMVDVPYEDEPYPIHLVHTVDAINAKRYEFECCVEIHHNSSVNPNVYGAQTIYWDTSELGKSLAKKIAFCMDEVRVVMSAPFKKFWKDIQKNYYQPGAMATLRHLKRRLHYLGQTKIPAVIVEVGYLSNEHDLRVIHKLKPQMAWAICKGIDEWLNGL